MNKFTYLAVTYQYEYGPLIILAGNPKGGTGTNFTGVTVDGAVNLTDTGMHISMPFIKLTKLSDKELKVNVSGFIYDLYSITGVFDNTSSVTKNIQTNTNPSLFSPRQFYKVYGIL